MSKAKATVAEQALQDAMRATGCMVTFKAHPGWELPIATMLRCNVPSQIHHITALDMGPRHQVFVLPLCPSHHPSTMSISKECFRRNYGYEWPLYFKILNEVINDLKPEHRVEILQKIDDYKESGHASVQFLQAYDKGRVGI